MADRMLEDLAAATSPGERAAVVAEAVFESLPESVAAIARGCVVLNWFDLHVVAALAPNSEYWAADAAYQQLRVLPFIESVPWGLAYHDLTRQALLSRYSEFQAKALIETAKKAAPAFAARSQDFAQVEAFYCYVVAGQQTQAGELLDRMVRQSVKRSDWGLLYGIFQLQMQAESLSFVKSLPQSALSRIARRVADPNEHNLIEMLIQDNDASTLDAGDTPVRHAVLRVLSATLTLDGQTTFYAAVLGLAALESVFPTGELWATDLTSVITHLARGENVREDEIRHTVKEAIVQSNVDGALQGQEFQAMIGRLLSQMNLLNVALIEGQVDIAKRLLAQAARHEVLFNELLMTEKRIGETTIRIDESATRIEDQKQGLLDRLQPSIDPAQQLEDARVLLASLPLEEIPDVGKLPPGSRMPFSPNPLFVGRADDLRALAAILKAGGTAAVGQVAAATGLGGIGKTQLAVEFAYRYGRFFAGGVFWLSLADPVAASAEVAACGLAMGLPGFDALDFPSQVERVRSAWQEPVPRLLIFDNCEEEELLAEWRPATGGSHVLVTSRRATWSSGLGVRSLALPVLPRAESVALLRRYRDDPAADDDVLDAIAAELGDLPLALHLAGNFLARYRHDVTPSVYLKQLQRPEGLRSHRSLITGDFSPTSHDSHVARTFRFSYDRLDPSDPMDKLALALLSRLACFAPGEPAQRELLLLTMNRDMAGPDHEAADALCRLAELGLVDALEDGAVVMHRLVAAFVLGLEGAEEAQGTVEEALGEEAGRLNEVGLPALLVPWQGHLRHVTDRALVRGDVRAALLCNELGSHLNQAGNLPTARPYLEQALAIWRRTLGEAHPDTALSLNNLGMLLQTMGDLPAAKAYLEQALTIRRQALGEVHPDTALSLNNLGMLLQAMGDLPAAKAYLKQALAIKRETLGKGHPRTAQSLNNVGSLICDMGDLPAARPYLEQALAIYRQALGEAHPDTATSLNNLGSLLYAMGDLPAAKAYLEQALTIRRQTLGEVHPHTATSLNNLGLLLRAMGDLSAAKAYLEQALAIYRQAVGEDHPDTAGSLNNLGTLLHDMGDLAAARPYYEQALAITRLALGESHPDTAGSLNNLGTLLQDMGDLAAARPYYEQALAITRQALGEAHPDTAQSLNNLGKLLQDMGDLPVARPYFEQAVAIGERSLGPDHPTTRIFRRNLERLLDELATAAPAGESSA